MNGQPLEDTPEVYKTYLKLAADFIEHVHNGIK